MSCRWQIWTTCERVIQRTSAWLVARRPEHNADSPWRWIRSAARTRRRASLCVGGLALVALLVLAPAARVNGAAARADVAGVTAVPPFEHVILIVFENKESDQVVGNPDAPTFETLARRYASLTDYRAVAHPSLPNYLALVSGSTQGIGSDCTSCQIDASNIADTLERAGKTWKTYAEGLPRPGFTGAWAGRYAKKHNPFLYFRDVLAHPSRLRRVVPIGRFARDLRAGQLPDFSMIVPDLCHDMHDCSVATGDRWLRSFLRPVLQGPVLRNGVVFVTFDEGSSNVGGGGHVPALALGPLVRPGSRSSAVVDHYGLLRTIEAAWGLPFLGRSGSARPINGIWR
jgi:phosphatidylinositol-3-phosphatase